MLSRAATSSNDASALVDPEALSEVARSCLARAGLEAGSIETAATLVEADLRGVHSHGVQNLPRYCRALLSGALNRDGECHLEVDAPGLCLLDARNNLGAIACNRAATIAGEHARVAGVCLVSVRNSNHCGALAYYSMRALEHDQIGICISNGPAVMAPFGSAEALIGNNPLSVAIPASDGPPIVLDMACSVAAKGWLRIYAREDRPIPDGWAVGPAGLPTTRAIEALSGALLPAGGHKGYGLAVVNELLAGALSLAQLSFQIPQAAVGDGSLGDDEQASWRCGQLVGAINVGTIVDVNEFKAHVDELASALRAARRAPGVDRVYLPGELEYECRSKRLVDGIPMRESILEKLNVLTEELGVAPLQSTPVEKGTS